MSRTRRTGYGTSGVANHLIDKDTYMNLAFAISSIIYRVIYIWDINDFDGILMIL